MSSIKEEVKKNLYQRCMCCLENENLLDMWAEHLNDDGEIVVYGDLLRECYEFPWIEPEEHSVQICEKCIERLKSSLSFRRDILAAKEVMDKLIEEHTKQLEIKVEVLYEPTEGNVKNMKQEDETSQEEQLDTEGEEIFEESLLDEKHTEMLYGTDDDDEEYMPDDTEMEIEYLDEDAEAAGTATSSVKRKWPKKKKKADRIKAYKQYSQEDLELAMKAVMCNKMTRTEAAEIYSIPVKTLGFKIRQKEMDENADSEAKSKQQQFFNEIKTILSYTNATPYKTKVGRLFCAYCGTDGPNFETDVDLRTHTRTKHNERRLRDVEIFMRPCYLNEILKLDIADLHCTVCFTPIGGWNEMFEHLKEKHSVELDLAYTKVIPFVLADEVICCLCRQSFPHFHMLDSHMNSHYVNYMCGECGDTFLTETRLKKHEEIHSTSQFPCGECGKTFTLEKYKNKHFNSVHLKKLAFKCKYCTESFSQEYTRHRHVVDKHPDKVKRITCEFCSMTFTWRPYHSKHVLKFHSGQKFKCKMCPKEFSFQNELKNHEDWHKGDGFTCFVCLKKFCTKTYLQKHIAGVHAYVVVEGNADGEQIIGT